MSFQNEELDELEGLEKIPSEQEDYDSEKPSYEIISYPADFTLQVLVDKLKKGLVVIPPFQRKYVWKQEQASKLVESFLLGLPVPPIYLYQEKTDKPYLVLDGQQRLKSIFYFFEGSFGEEQSGKNTVFRLVGLNEKSPFLNKTYKDLENTNNDAFNKLNDSILRSFLIKQVNPRDNTSIFHIFERLNTGGTLLKGQEIRNCVCYGDFSKLLNELNLDSDWRKIFGQVVPQKQQRDTELILRFLTLFYGLNSYEKPMKDFLTDFMKRNQNLDSDKAKEFSELFRRTTKSVIQNLGEKPFHIKAGLNAAVFDSVYYAFSKNGNRVPSDIKKRYSRLLDDEDFKKQISSHTTDKEVIPSRVNKAISVLFD